MAITLAAVIVWVMPCVLLLALNAVEIGNSFTYLTQTAQELAFVTAALGCAYVFGEKQAIRFLHLKPPHCRMQWAAAMMFAIAAIPGINLLAMWNAQISLANFWPALDRLLRTIEEQNAAVLKQLMCTANTGGLCLNLLIIALGAAVSEEFLFRGTLQHTLQQHCGVHVAVWITAFLFSAVHLQFFGFVPRMLLGAAFGYMLVWSGSLWVPIMAHFLNNAYVVIGAFAAAHGIINEATIDILGTHSTTMLGLVSIAFAVGMMWLIKRYSAAVVQA